MADNDQFIAQLAAAVRALPDSALVDLVREKLGTPSHGPQPKVKKRAAPTVNREDLLLRVEKAVKASGGLSAGEVASRVNAPQAAVARALKDLRAAKRIAMAGDRRFARYAADAKTAAKASSAARKS